MSSYVGARSNFVSPFPRERFTNEATIEPDRRLGISDHDAVLFEVNMSPRCPPKPPRKILQYHKADFDGLRSHLSSIVLHYVSRV